MPKFPYKVVTVKQHEFVFNYQRRVFVVGWFILHKHCQICNVSPYSLLCWVFSSSFNTKKKKEEKKRLIFKCLTFFLVDMYEKI